MTLTGISHRVREATPRAFFFVGGGVLLLFTWLVLYYVILATTEAWLAPWDLVHVSQRPPVGTWARTINDFFEHEPGATVPAQAILATSVLLFTARLARGGRRAVLPLEFAMLNGLFVILDFALVLTKNLLTSLWLGGPRSSLDVGYHHTWPAIAITACLLLALFLTQATNWPGKRLLRSTPVQVLFVFGTLAFLFIGCLVPFFAIQ